MTADERLDQLEPLMSEALAVLDRHTAQLKQHTVVLKQHTGILEQHTVLLEHLSTAVGQQSDNISFLLHEQAEMKTQQGAMDGKLDLIITLLQRPG